MTMNRPPRHRRTPNRFGSDAPGDIRDESPLLLQQQIWLQEAEAAAAARRLRFAEPEHQVEEVHVQDELEGEEEVIEERNPEREEDDEVEDDIGDMVFQDDEVEDDHPANFRQHFNLWNLPLMWAFVAIPAILWMLSKTMYRGSITKQMSSPTEPRLQFSPCFESVNMSESNDRWCDLSKDRIPCPTGGTCVDGELLQCDSRMGLIKYKERQCILSETANKSIASAYQDLRERTVNHYCTLGATEYNTRVDISTPSFPMKWLVKESQALAINLFVSSQDFWVDEKNETIALQDEIAWSIIPLQCRFRLAMIRVFEPYEKAFAEDIPEFVFGTFNNWWQNGAKAAVKIYKKDTVLCIMILVGGSVFKIVKFFFF